MAENSSGFMDPCEVPVNDRRFYLIAICGTSFSIISCLENVMICYALLAKRKHRNSHFLYLALLAFSDGFLSFCYGPVIAMDIIKNYVKLVWLNRVWWYYVGPMLALCHVAMAWSCYLIILATVERYLVTIKANSLSWVRKNRIALIVCSFVAALITKGTFIFEVELVQNGNCTGLTEFKPVLAPIVHNYFYGTIFKFYLRNLFTVFIPFFLLAYLNARILNILRQQHRSARMFRFAASDHKDKVRSASRILVLVVFTYLISNVLNVAVTAWEHIDMNSVEQQWEFYEWCTDIISVLTVAGCALRLPIYWTCNEEIRLAVQSGLRHLPSRLWGGPKRLYNQTQRMTRARKQQHNQIGTEFDSIAVAIACSVMKHHGRLLEISNAGSRQISRQNSRQNSQQKDSDDDRRHPSFNDDDDDGEEETKVIFL